MPLPAGKLPMRMLQRMLRQYTHGDERVPIGAGLGRDAAVIEFGDRLLIAKTDPITFVAEDLGYYAVHINANDVACMGGEPRWFMAALLMPAGQTTESEVEHVFAQISRACNAMKIKWCGGHTEITPDLQRPIVVGCLLAEAPLNRRYAPDQIEPGDCIILTKGLAVEATSIMGREKGEVLTEVFEARFVKQCRQYLFEPGISVLPEARIAWETPGIHALHDPTEGGLANAINELLLEKNLGVEIDWSQVLLFPETKVICEHFGLDPAGIIASGALLIIGEEGACQTVLQNLRRAKIDAAMIGRILPKGEDRWLIDGKERSKLPVFHFDEILRVLE